MHTAVACKTERDDTTTCAERDDCKDAITCKVERDRDTIVRPLWQLTLALVDETVSLSGSRADETEPSESLAAEAPARAKRGVRETRFASLRAEMGHVARVANSACALRHKPQSAVRTLDALRCARCAQQHYTQKALLMHMLREHHRQCYACGTCFARYSTIRALRRHLQIKSACALRAQQSHWK